MAGQLGVKHQFIEALDYNHCLRINPAPATGLEPFDITFVDANHCPGSVMIVLRGNNFAFLYTGDARVNDYVIRTVQSIGVPRFDKAYIDSTFYDTFGNWDMMPSVYQSVDSLLGFLSGWKGRIAFEFELLGTEILLEAVLEHFPRQKILVADQRRFNELDIVFNSSPQIMSRLWVGDIEKASSRFVIIPRDAPTPKGFIRLRPSTQRWGTRIMHLESSRKLDLMEVDEAHAMAYLFFSFHSCKREIDHMISILNVREVNFLTPPIETARFQKPSEVVCTDGSGSPMETTRSNHGAPFQFSCDGMWLDTLCDSQETVFQGDSGELPIILPTKGDV